MYTWHTLPMGLYSHCSRSQAPRLPALFTCALSYPMMLVVKSHCPALGHPLPEQPRNQMRPILSANPIIVQHFWACAESDCACVRDDFLCGQCHRKFHCCELRLPGSVPMTDVYIYSFYTIYVAKLFC